jgi:hypothetical protein
MQMVRRGMVKGMEITSNASHFTPCEPCLQGKQTHNKIHKVTETCADVVLGHVFSDVCGKMGMCSHRGFEYFVTFTDDKSRKVFVTGLHKKSKVTCHLKAFIAYTEVETGQCLHILCSDRGGEYTGGGTWANT